MNAPAFVQGRFIHAAILSSGTASGGDSLNTQGTTKDASSDLHFMLQVHDKLGERSE